DMRRLAEALSGNDVDRVYAYADDLQRVVDSVRAGDTALALNVIRTKIGLGAAMDVLDSSRGEADRSTHADDLAALEQVAALHPDAATFESWLSDALSRPGSPDGVTLSTVHRVKGREWPHVIVFGANEGLFPHRLSQDVEEERRVFHVAVTRARSQAVVVADPDAPSPFCAELSGTAPRVQLTATRSTVAVKPKAHANSSVPMSPPQPATPGLAVTLRGGIDAVVVDVDGDERGVVVTPVGGEGRLVVGWGTEVRVAGATVRLVRPGGPSPEAALAALKAWRKEVSTRDKVPAYIVFSDDHLSGIASTLPGSLAELAACRGVGPAKLERYGDDVLRVIEETPR
ncbi:MAG: ATP-dependent helicase UvrD/PcrA, partial [Acidimicrobiaceae bacterium]|nr:ATP-dependent helicase UvrD/PcrA [Acidimicrobiaceae bacterium]